MTRTEAQANLIASLIVFLVMIIFFCLLRSC